MRVAHSPLFEDDLCATMLSKFLEDNLTVISEPQPTEVYLVVAGEPGELESFNGQGLLSPSTRREASTLGRRLEMKSFSTSVVSPEVQAVDTLMAMMHAAEHFDLIDTRPGLIELQTAVHVVRHLLIGAAGQRLLVVVPLPMAKALTTAFGDKDDWGKALGPLDMVKLIFSRSFTDKPVVMRYPFK